MIVRKLRLQRGWSQEQLSHFSGLSIRTIQRIERGQKASMESLKSLAAVFEVNIEDLEQETPMQYDTNQAEGTNYNDRPRITHEEELAIRYVKDIKDFYTHLAMYVIIIAGLFIFNYFITPQYWWAFFPMFGWGIGVLGHGLAVFEVFNFFSPEWEKRQIEKRLGRKL